MVIITDILQTPFDEGAKVAIYNLLMEFKKQFSCFIILVNSSKCDELADYQVSANKFLYNKKLNSYIRNKGSKQILYAPEASITFASFIRAKLLQISTSAKVIILSKQPRHYSRLQRKIIVDMLKPAGVITQSIALSNKLIQLGIPSTFLPFGVDTVKFHAPSLKKKF